MPCRHDRGARSDSLRELTSDLPRERPDVGQSPRQGRLGGAIQRFPQSKIERTGLPRTYRGRVTGPGARRMEPPTLIFLRYRLISCSKPNNTYHTSHVYKHGTILASTTSLRKGHAEHSEPKLNINSYPNTGANEVHPQPPPRRHAPKITAQQERTTLLPHRASRIRDPHTILLYENTT